MIKKGVGPIQTITKPPSGAKSSNHTQQRGDELKHQLQRRQLAIEIRAYCDDLSQVDNHDAEWVAWARKHADSIDPLLNGTSRMPTEPQVTNDALKPFLKGWSPYGPKGY